VEVSLLFITFDPIHPSAMKKQLLSLCTVLLMLIQQVSGQGIDKPIYQIVTYRDTAYLGAFEIELFPLIAPLHVQNFDSLAGQQFFDSTAFHRVVPGFVIQGGDPNTISGPISTWGQGQPWQPTVNAEFNAVRHNRGILGAARDTNINSANSQFYICTANAFFLDGQYTVYGKVISGMNIVDSIVASPRDVNDVPLQKITMFVTETGVNDSVPAAPGLIQPVDSSLHISSTQMFQWTSVPGAVMYSVEVATDSLFANVILDKDFGVTQTNTLAVPGSGNYFWRVKANNGGHESAWSPVWRFSSVTDSTILVFPPDSSLNIFMNPVVTWNPVPMADNYQLQLGFSQNFGPLTLLINQSGIQDTAYQSPMLQANTRYYWRVRSYDGIYPGYYSKRFTFVTGNLVGQSEIVSQPLYFIYPNPADDNVTVDFSESDARNVTISLLDLSGRQLETRQINGNDQRRISLNVSEYAAGMYLLQIMQDGLVSSEKLIVR